MTPLEGDAIRLTVSPLQMIPSLLVVPEVSVNAMLGLGNELTVTVADADAKQLVVEFVTVTVYEVVDEGETTLLLPLALIGAAHT